MTSTHRNPYEEHILRCEDERYEVCTSVLMCLVDSKCCCFVACGVGVKRHVGLLPLVVGGFKSGDKEEYLRGVSFASRR